MAGVPEPEIYRLGSATTSSVCVAVLFDAGASGELVLTVAVAVYVPAPGSPTYTAAPVYRSSFVSCGMVHRTGGACVQVVPSPCE